ncbi:uncharacterized protein ACLA_041010 [Aspergillus clavatus NRRL 1]|uniref:Uncharacterized protein n=1 Tax=Aspergillus clavatus (strain ATCC 1007 / CBS 513.65 / DSM 816 / NCTC 3887 / NRRL 1 / QM 1276 / 107) TaxID=344612 RepID=A1CL61_ASPCL|nr:uncharacterized protein ACLA_041010 [Aspergillus clavatus NRRL 1]EAW09885.1 hypothetical protein ACLA_041010 [Aspergillus clavatus NRRL 1]
MRTRSQPLSPGGFIALDSEPRRTRSTRSTSRQPSAEPATTTRSTRSASIRQPSVEPVTQSATRTRRSASVRQPSAEPEAQPRTRATRSASVRQSSAEPPTQTATRPRTQRTSNSKKPSSKATETQTRRRAASIRRSTRQPSRKTSLDEIEQDRTGGASQSASVTDDQDPQAPEGSETIPSMVDTALSEPKASDSEYTSPNLPRRVPAARSPAPSPSPSPKASSHPSRSFLKSITCSPPPSPLKDEVPLFPSPKDQDPAKEDSLEAVIHENQSVPYPSLARESAAAREAQNPKESKLSTKIKLDGGLFAHTDTCQYLPLEEISDIGSPLSERSHTPSVESENLQLGIELDEALLAGIDACLALHCQVETAAAQAPAKGDSDGYMTIERECDPIVSLLFSGTYSPELPAVMEATTEPTIAAQLFSKITGGPESWEEQGLSSPMSVPGRPSSNPDSSSTLVNGVCTAAIDTLWIGSREISRESSLSPPPSIVSDEDILVSSVVAAVSSSFDKEVVALIQSFSELCLADTTYDDTPPAPVTLLSLLSVPTDHVQQDLIFSSPIESGTASIFHDGRLKPAKESELVPDPSSSYLAAAEFHSPRRPRRASCSMRKYSARWARVPLSPIPEELEMMSPRPGLGVGSDAKSVHAPPTPLSATSPLPDLDFHCAQGRTSKRADAKKEPRLTPRKVNRKRPYDDEPQTPQANKRRNLGLPGTTPLARRMTSLSRQVTVPYSERKRRRTIEGQGRIHKTVFRLPQLLAQNEADRRAAESTPLGPCPEPLQSASEAAEEHVQEDVKVPAAEVATQTPSTPEGAPSGWNIRGLINSVPRTFSRFLPGFGRSSRTAEPPETPQASSNISAKPAVQPSSERITRTQNVDSEPGVTETRDRSHRRLSEQPASKRQRTLTYSLFPPPIDRARFLGDLSTTPKKTLQPVQPAPRLEEQVAQLQKVPESDAQVDEHRPSRQSSEESTKKKRKRSPSPDVIPNPPGCSYGLDLDYFCYSSESEEETDSQAQPLELSTKPDPLVKSVVRSALRSERALSKKVRFDASPEDTPSKLRTRARATDPYEGKHFVGMGDVPRTTAPGSPAPTRAPPTPTPGSRMNLFSPQRASGFIPNTQGTFQLDYDAFSDDSDSSGAPSPATVPALEPVAAETRISTALRSEVQESVQSPAPRQTPRQALPPSTPAKVDKEALARVRSQAEKYKPKTPSGLRTASRYSSPLTLTPDIVTPQQPVESFGEDDQFARDAQWLYENCSSGDLKQLQWPAKHDLQQSSGVDKEAIKIVAELWDSVDLDNAQRVFQQTFEEFAKSLA